MDWRYGPGEWPKSLPSDQPSADTVAAYARLLDGKLSHRNFDRDYGDTLWRQIDAEVATGRLSGEEAELLRRDHDGLYTIPLARRYLDAGQAAAITKWMRNLASFWSYAWIDTSLRGARGRGTWRMFETLRLHGGAVEGGDLAAEHLWFRLIGARYHEGLRQELRQWHDHNDREQRRRKVLDHRTQYGKPHHIEVLFDWLDHIAEGLRPFIAAGSEDAKVRLARVENEVAKSRAKFVEDLLG